VTGAILVVDDERDLAVTCERLLRRRGWSVLTTGTREGGLAVLGRETRPALAIVDRQLPGGEPFSSNDLLELVHRIVGEPSPGHTLLT
jgi:DNA-binding response OmpR family regulator